MSTDVYPGYAKVYPWLFEEVGGWLCRFEEPPVPADAEQWPDSVHEATALFVRLLGHVGFPNGTIQDSTRLLPSMRSSAYEPDEFDRQFRMLIDAGLVAYAGDGLGVPPLVLHWLEQDVAEDDEDEKARAMS